MDAPGSTYDNERDSETGRDLLDAAELRQMVEHSQAVVITGTAPPIIAGFPPFSKGGPVAHSLRREVPHPVSLKDAEVAFAIRQIKEDEAKETIAAGEEIIMAGITDDESAPKRVNAHTDSLEEEPQESIALSGPVEQEMNMDASAILGILARDDSVENKWEIDLNQPRRPGQSPA